MKTLVILLIFILFSANSHVHPFLECQQNNTVIFGYTNTGNQTETLDSNIYNSTHTFNFPSLPRTFLPGTHNKVFEFNKYYICNETYNSFIAQYNGAYSSEYYVSITIFPSTSINSVKFDYIDKSNVKRTLYMTKHPNDIWAISNFNGNLFKYIDEVEIETSSEKKTKIFVHDGAYKNNKKNDYIVTTYKYHSNSTTQYFRIIPDFEISDVEFHFRTTDGHNKVLSLRKSIYPNLWTTTNLYTMDTTQQFSVWYIKDRDIKYTTVNFLDTVDNICEQSNYNFNDNKCTSSTWCHNKNSVFWSIKNMNNKVYRTRDLKFLKNCDVQKYDVNSIYSLTSKWNSKVIDIIDGKLEQYANLQMWDYVTGANQKWYFEYDKESNAYYIMTAMNNKCITQFENSIRMEDCCNNDNQKFYIDEVNKDEFEIKSIINNKCIDIKDWNPFNGAELQFWECTGWPNQVWKLVKLHIVLDEI